MIAPIEPTVTDAESATPLLRVRWSTLMLRNPELVPTDNHPPDNDIHCKRENGETYVVFTLTQWRRLRIQGKLGAYLEKKRR